MKRKFYGVLMLGALAVASASLTSCKDYDDDINNLQAQIDTKAEKTALEDTKTALQTTINTLSAELKAEDTRLAGLIAEKAENSALTAAVARVAALEARLTTAENAMSSLQELINGKVDQSVYNTAVADIYGKLETVQSGLGDALKQIPALEKGLQDEETARKAAIQNLQTQIDALNGLSSRLAALESFKASADAANYQQQINDLKAELETVKANAGSGSTATIEALKDEMTKASKSVENVEASVAVLTVLVNNSLTSVTLIPQHFIDGIEAIQFQSLKYIPVKFNGTIDPTSGTHAGHVPAYEDLTDHQLASAGSAVIIDRGQTEASYRLSPTLVKQEDIDIEKLKYSCTTAKTETRAASLKDDNPVKPTFKSLENGVLTVVLKKTNTNTSLEFGGEGKTANIVSLMVPRKANEEKNISYAEIYSEFTMLDETTIEPRLAALNTNDGGKTWHFDGTGKLKHDKTIANQYHYIDSLSIWKTGTDNALYIKHEIKYDEDFDLNQLVTGCYLDGAGKHVELTKEELRKSGLTFRFAIPTTVYNTDNVNNTDQQGFANLKANDYNGVKTVIYSKLNEKLNGAEVTKNRAAIDKAPIIRVMLIDSVRNNLVDQAYFRIKWVGDVTPPLDAVKLNDYKTSAELSCNDIVSNMGWSQFINYVYGVIKAEKPDMSYEEFKAVYTTQTVSPASLNLTLNVSALDEDADVAKWTITPDEVGKILPNRSKDMKATITFVSAQPQAYPNLILDWIVTINLPNKPTLHGYYANYWLDATYTAHDVMPVQYLTAAQTRPYCVYENNLFNAFTYNTRNGNPWMIIDNLPEPCGAWDIQFKQAQMSGYKANFTGSEPELNVPVSTYTDATFGAYDYIKTPNTTALQINWAAAATSAPWAHGTNDKPYLFADHKNPANYGVINEIIPNGIGKAPERTHTKPVNMGIYAQYNQWNAESILDYKIYLVAPLGISSQLDGYFEEGLVSGSDVDCRNAFNMVDFRGYLVKKGTTTGDEFHKYADALYTYYEVTDPVFDLSKVKYGLKVENGNIVADNNAQLNATHTDVTGGMTAAQIEAATNGNVVLSITQPSADVLRFKNNGGSNVEFEVQVFIPATITYGFGTLTQYVQVPLYPRGQVK